MYGGLGVLGTPVVRTDAAAIWATGRTWWQVPPVARVELTGDLSAGVSGKDVIITLCGLFNDDEVLNHALEFTGDGLAGLAVDERLTIANMTTEWGALVGLFPIDEVTINWLEQRAQAIATRGLEGVPSDADGNGQHPRMNAAHIADLKANRPVADSDAYYTKTITLDLATVAPQIAGPDNVKTMTSAIAMAERGIPIHKAYLVSCVNSRVDDLAVAARVVKGHKVADGVEFYIAAASREVQAASEARGDWQALVEAGAIALLPGCGPCIGLGQGLLEDGEVGISATNRNFKGRMGSRDAQAYLASPSVVAASAIAGKIVPPPNVTAGGKPRAQVVVHPVVAVESAAVTIMDGFPKLIEGELLFCHQDSLNTDGIFPGKYTYIDNFTPEQQAAVVMENYDPNFGKIVLDGDLLVGGYNFGSGSSREQAATAFKYRGIKLVLAGSFSETYKRNAINNGFLVLEAPELVDQLKADFGETELTVRTKLMAQLDFGLSLLTVGDTQYKLKPLGQAAQELILVGGLEAWVQKQI